MTFVSTTFLFAAAAGAIPVVLHMINRQQAKKLPFSTLRFLRISAEKTRRRKRIHDVLLMLLRMTVLILIAIGLAEPTVTSLSRFWGSGASAVAIILDNSASMGTIDEGRARFETARAAARQVVNEIGDGGEIALLLTGGPGFADEGQLHRAHDVILQMLDQAHVSYERANLAMQLQDAKDLLAQSEAPNKQVFVISDMQALSWEGLPDDSGTDPGETAGDGPKSAVPVVLVDCNRNPKPNVAVTDVQFNAFAPVAGMPISAVAELFNASTIPQQRHLELYVDGTKAATSPELEISPGARVRHEFEFVPKHGGLYRGEVRLVGEDGSRYDDQRYFTLEVDQEIPVAIVKPERHEISYLEDTYYLEQALAPTRSGGWAIHPTTLTSSELVSEPLSNYEVVFCVNLVAPSADTARRLRDYAAGGGNLFWIVGDNVDVAEYNGMNEAVGGQLLPSPLLDVRLPSPSVERDSWHIASLDEGHPAMAPLAEPPALYQSVLVYKYVRTDTSSAPKARVLARLDNGDALLSSARIERGSVTLLGTSAHVGWSNLPVRPIFLPLLARLTFDLSGAEQARYQALAGAPLALPLGDQQQIVTVEILPPTGATIHLDSQPRPDGTGQEFAYTDTHGIGVYTLRARDTARPVTIAYSVNGDGNEAEPETLSRADLEGRMGRTPAVFADDPDDLSSTFRKLREGESLWELVLGAVLLALVSETLISNLLNPGKSDRGSPTDEYGSLPVRSGFGYKSESPSKSVTIQVP